LAESLGPLYIELRLPLFKYRLLPKYTLENVGEVVVEEEAEILTLAQ
jgi:hypothetical protein